MIVRTPNHWQDEVPGTRWFRADLHIHTIDDPPRELPADLSGERTNPAVLEGYARHVLDAAVAQGVEVLGLTPHSAYVQVGVSAVLSVRDLWMTGTRASDGRPYRDLIFAVYPGFEPNFQDGKHGLHLLFLFDPEVERNRFLNAFSALMGGRLPYTGKTLERTTLAPSEAFELLDDPKVLGRDAYIVVAAHPTQDNGLFHRPDHDIRDLVGDRVLALELSRNATLEEERSRDGKFRFAYTKGRAVLHNSDANHLPAPGLSAKDRELGHRFTLLKLGRPTLGALRQALLARDARTRLPFVRGPGNALIVDPALPTACPVGRPWVRSVHVQGGTSFHRDQVFRFSPDLTCIIGGSMTGKSTLLDGLRFLFGGEAGLPDVRSSLGAVVHARAIQRFASGKPTIEIDSPAGDVSLPVPERFGMRFFSQGELKSLSEDADGVEHLIFHLVPGKARALLTQREQLAGLDGQIAAAATRLTALEEQVGEAEQAFKRTHDARTAMERFAQAGTATLPPAQQDAARTADFVREVRRTIDAARDSAGRIDGLAIPAANAQGVVDALGASTGQASAAEVLAAARTAMSVASQHLDELLQRAEAAATIANRELAARTGQVQAALVATGGSAADLNQFDAYARAAQHFDSFKAALDLKVAEVKHALLEFNRLVSTRDQVITEHRHGVREVCEAVAQRFGGTVLVQVHPEGRKAQVESWVLGRKAKGVTQWWNSGGAQTATATAVRDIAGAVARGDTADALTRCEALGMSDAIARSFLEQLAPRQRQLEVWTLRAPDRYEIQWVEGGVAKNLDDLSGGRKVAVLLSLLLESDDPTPLVIDQPEDELDNRFLNETIIPALHRLKGKRQVIFATHNANIVVNGDADQVIVLEADAQHGRIHASGAIEDADVRDAILRTLDGGEDAFRLRRAKYGF